MCFCEKISHTCTTAQSRYKDNEANWLKNKIWPINGHQHLHTWSCCGYLARTKFYEQHIDSRSIYCKSNIIFVTFAVFAVWSFQNNNLLNRLIQQKEANQKHKAWLVILMKALYANCTLSVTQAADGLSMGTTSCRLVCHKFNTQTTWSSQHLQQTLRNKYEKKQQNCRHGRLEVLLIFIFSISILFSTKYCNTFISIGNNLAKRLYNSAVRVD